jgi:hypothetical protein
VEFSHNLSHAHTFRTCKQLRIHFHSHGCRWSYTYKLLTSNSISRLSNFYISTHAHIYDPRISTSLNFRTHLKPVLYQCSGQHLRHFKVGCILNFSTEENKKENKSSVASSAPYVQTTWRVCSESRSVGRQSASAFFLRFSHATRRETHTAACREETEANSANPFPAAPIDPAKTLARIAAPLSHRAPPPPRRRSRGASR